MRHLLLVAALLVLAGGVRPASAQVTLPTNACPSDRTDGPLYADGTAWYGIPARRIVENFLAPPHDSHGRLDSGTQNVDAATLRILTDRTDAEACRRLSYYLSNQTSHAHDGRSIYFTAGGFYFVSQWHPAMALSNLTTGYAYVMVFDSSFNMLGVYTS
jgi:hypothetical protein